MVNRFYQDFDTEPHGGGARPEDYRSPFQIDRDRLIYSAPFRRLQSKTQVFIAGQYDFYRTRLTHTIEVAQVGRSLCQWLRHHSELLEDDFFIDADLVEACCLAHDIGHPPFGHTGEATLNELSAEYGGFEGNAQTLRLLTETLYQGERGIAPTRALVDGILKYKTLHREWIATEGRAPKRHFVYDEQRELLDWVHGGTDFPDRAAPGRRRNAQRAIECQIMDWADDTAYSLNDLADGVQAKFVTIALVESWAADQTLDEDEQRWVEALIGMVREDRVEGRLGRKIGEFIQAAGLREAEGMLAARSHRYCYDLTIDPLVKKECSLYKRIAREVIFDSHKLQQLDRKADLFLRRLWDEFWTIYHERDEHRFDLIPRAWGRRVLAAPSERLKSRLIADWIGGMTDAFALRTYRRLFDPSFGSISDWV